MRSFRSSKRHQAGLGLLEVLLAITVSLVVGAIAADQLRNDNETKQASAGGDQLHLVGNAFNTYVALYYNKIVNLTSVGGSCPAVDNTTDTSMAGTANDPGPRCCDPASGLCSINSDTLRRAGLLPNSFSGYNSYGAKYVYRIRVQGSAPNYIVDGLVYTDQAYTTTGTTPRYDLLGVAIQQAGADAGMTRSVANRVEGLNGAWSESAYPTSGSWAGPNMLGLLAYRVGYGTSGYAAYLRLDGASAMTGNLDLGGHSINNVGTLHLNAPASSGASVLHVNSTGVDTGTDVSVDNAAGGLVVRNDKGVKLTTLNGSSYSDLTARNGIFSGSVTAGSGGNIITANGLTGTLTAPTINAGTITTTGNVNIKNGYGLQFDVNGDGVADGGWYMSDTVWVRAVNNKNVFTGGEVRASNLTALSHVYVGTAGGTTRGSACSNLTTTGFGDAIPIVKDSASNELLQCKNGVWSPLGVTVTTVSAATTTTNGSTYSVATCPTNTTMTGGGYALTAYGGSNVNSPDQSFPDAAGNAWRVLGSNAAPSGFRAYAVCAY